MKNFQITQWPGNIRELQHSIEKAVILSDSSVLGPADFSFNTASKGVPDNDNTTLEEMEKEADFRIN